MPNLTGQSIGRYHILEQLGEGGMATVYKAYDTRLERNVAFKVLRTDLFGQAVIDQVLKRFEREAKSLAKLSHSNIVNILDYGEHEGMPYLVMEYLPGGTLKQKLGQKIPWQEALQILLPVARGLAYAHRHNVIHRDVKPANILMKEENIPVLTDFGIAKILEGVEGHTLTASGVGIGTPEYMAPEQGIGASTIDARADIYSLGIVLYEMITGRKPYIADTPMAVILKQITDPLPRPTDFVPDIPEGVENLLFKALAKQPEDRYENMDALIMALESLSASRLTLSAPPMPVETVPKTDLQTIAVQAAGEKILHPQVPKKIPSRFRLSPKIILPILGVIVIGGLALFLLPGLLAKPIPTPTVELTITSTPSPTDQVSFIPVLSTATLDLVQVNRDLWAGSPHADSESSSFTNWNSADPQEIPVTCANCHSQTGFLDYLGVDGSTPELVNSATSIGEVLECQTCHEDDTNYVMRAQERVLFSGGARLGFSTNNPSNLCLNCHQSRNSTRTLDQAIGMGDPDTPQDSLNFMNPHYALAGSTLFGVDAGSAYEYYGRVYLGRNLHVDGFSTCSDCHDPHSTALSLEACTTCHAGPFASPTDLRRIRSTGDEVDYDGDGNNAEGVYGEIETLNQILYRTIQMYSRRQLGRQIGYYEAAFPFYFIDTNGDGTIQDDEAQSDNRWSPWTPRLLRAVYNYHYSVRNPGTYTHNPRYILQILFDTLQDLEVDVSALTRP